MIKKTETTAKVQERALETWRDRKTTEFSTRTPVPHFRLVDELAFIHLNKSVCYSVIC
jgi:hypothetical protein